MKHANQNGLAVAIIGLMIAIGALLLLSQKSRMKIEALTLRIQAIEQRTEARP